MNEFFWNEKLNGNWKDDWSEKVSPDEDRIIKWCQKRSFLEKNILHVGFGSSKLASLIPAKQIDGITIIPEEIEKSKFLNIANYKTYLCNKYSLFINKLPNKYDFIIDNNLFNFTDCDMCIFNYFHSLVSLLKDNGEIITDTGGMFWAKSWTIERYKILIEDFTLPLSIVEYKESSPNFVIGLKKCDM